MFGIRGKLETIVLVSALALALVVSAFAHRVQPVSATQSVRVDLEAFRLPDGSLPSFCISPGDGPFRLQTDTCDFCTLAHGAGLPRGSVIPDRAAAPTDSPSFVKAHIVAPSIFSPGTPSTGPPVIS